MYTLKENIFSRKGWLGAAGVFVVALIVAGSLGLASRHASASGTDNTLHGYAWSASTGWISFNCAEGSSTGGSVCSTSNYAVSIDPGTGAITGYGWSSNIGWVSFQPADVASCGPAAALVGTSLTGWARVISESASDGADGCINLGGTSGGTYYFTGVRFDPVSGVFSGFGWGDINQGWIDFSAVHMAPSPTAPTAALTVFDGSTSTDFSTITYPSIGSPISISLHSVTNNVSSCTASASYPASDWNSTTSIGLPTAFSSVINPGTPGTYLYTITCTPTDTVSFPASVSSTATVIITSTGPASCMVVPSASATETSGSPFTATSSFGVAWSGLGSSPVPTSTVTVDGSTTPFTTSIVGSPVLTLPSSTATVSVSGTMPTSTQTVVVNATGGGTSCTPATYTFNPSSSTTTTGTTGPRRPPWKEF